LLKEKVD